MKIVIYWTSKESQDLLALTKDSLETIWLIDFVQVESTDSTDYASALWITKDPAFCVEEESLEFKDMIFEWEVPPKQEIDNLLVSIIWGDASCSTAWCSWNCFSCH